MPKADLSPAEVAVTDSEFQPHLAALGLSSAEEYVRWCAERGLSTRLKKHWRDRARERFSSQQQLVARRQKLARQQSRQPWQTLDALFAGNLPELDLTQPHLRQIHALLALLDDGETKQAFHQLLQRALSCGGFLSTLPV